MFLLIFFIFFQWMFLSFASEGFLAENQDEIIKLNVGGHEFQTRKSTLCKDPQSPLAKIFNNKSGMKPGDMTDKGLFLDEDPEIFNYLLDYLRYETIPRVSLKKYPNLKIMADKYLPSMLPLIPKPAKKQEKKKQENLTAINVTNIDGKLNWFLYDIKRGKIIGCKKHGNVSKAMVEDYIKEYENRKIHKDLVYSWSGWGEYIYNIKTSIMIGEYFKKWRDSNIPKVSSYMELGLIESIVSKNGKRYVCAVNNEGSFSAFNVDTNEKVLAGEKFKKLDECVFALQNGFGS